MAGPSFPPPPPPPQPIRIDASTEDLALAASSHLTRHELLTRRSRRLKQLARLYEAHYWTLMEHLRIKYKDYYWKYGKSPFKADHKTNGDTSENFADGNGKLRFYQNEDGGGKSCAASGCKANAMALTRYCHPHILQDSKQNLYKGCTFVVKSAQGRPILCRKPVLRSVVPALCSMHFEKAERHVARALRSFGLNVSSPSKLAPKLHVIVAEFVRQIQSKRRAVQRKNAADVQIEERLELSN